MCQLSDYPFESHYQDVLGYRLHYLDEGDKEARTILFLHGVPTWSYTFRKIIPSCVRAGYRVISLDLPGLGLSEKPVPKKIFSMDWLVTMVGEFMVLKDLFKPMLFAHDWGGVIGLLLASSKKVSFSGIILCNSLLPIEGMKIPFSFRLWRFFVRFSPLIPVGKIVNLACERKLSRQEKHGYNFPFASAIDKRAIRMMPGLLPLGKGHKMFSVIEKTWSFLAKYEQPVLTLFSDGDPITRGGEKVIQSKIPGALNQKHKLVTGGHFVQEDAPVEITNSIIGFMKSVQ